MRSMKGKRRVTELPRLQEWLPLHGYMCSLLGFPDPDGLRSLLKDAQLGAAEDGHTHFFHRLRGQAGLKVDPDRLAQYDLRILDYTDRINEGRSPRVKLQYFQYLAVLFTEILLERYFADRPGLLAELNAFASDRYGKGARKPLQAPHFGEEDLTKLAVWMATGSGKTLILHINLLQYLRHSAGKAEHSNILLITPNEGLSRQHLNELRKSGIPALHYASEQGTLESFVPDVVKVIEITKLTETKRGGGLTVEVDAFGVDNLLLVDEGHRGATGDVWRELRSKLALKGFTFEYSATFGQVVNGAPDDRHFDLLEEYSKAIVFDYSYPHFYEDGYGKDYWVVNWKSTGDEFNDWIALGNLVSFYEQCLAFEENPGLMRENSLERPLWIFVGHSVTGGKTREDEESLTDIQQVVIFLSDFIAHKKTWVGKIRLLLSGKTELRDSSNEDLFKDSFHSLRQKALAADQLYEGILAEVLHASAGGVLQAIELKNAAGEIALSAGADKPYFGLINVGDAPGLMDILRESGIASGEDNLSGSLFDQLGRPESRVMVLIGAKKFMEGWDSYRVSSMGLLNIGRGEGSQIVQLFGRGVRLHGRGRSLKRNTAVEGRSPSEAVSLLETLSVFGVRANYMEKFRENLSQEGIETDFENMEIPIQVQEDFLRKDLRIVRLPPHRSFADEECVFVGVDPGLRVELDLRPRLELVISGSAEPERGERAAGEDATASLREISNLLDWNRIEEDLTGFCKANGYSNMVVRGRALRDVLTQGDIEVILPPHRLPPTQFLQLRYAEEVTIGLLRKYAITYYRKRRQKWEQEHVELGRLSSDDPDLAFGGYSLRIERAIAAAVTGILRRIDDLYNADRAELKSIHFDRHLYAPLLAFGPEDRMKASPPPLNAGEARFVRDLRSYLASGEPKLGKNELFLLRNLSRGRGVGFFEPGEGEAFYPDFVLWLINPVRQTIAFIDPHGLRNVRGMNDPKLRLHESLKLLESHLRPESLRGKVQLKAFIVATDSYENLAKTSWVRDHAQGDFEKKGVFFQDAKLQYVQQLIGAALAEG